MSPPKQRKRPDYVTPNACTECKRRRTKCDGEHPCSTCAARDWRSCVYEVHQRTAVRLLTERIGSLDAHCNTSDRILEAIATGDNSAAIVQQLQDGESHVYIASQLLVQPPSPPEPYPDPETWSSAVTEGSVPLNAEDQSEGSIVFDTRFQKGKSSVTSTELDQEPRSPYLPARGMSHYGKRPHRPRIKSEGHLNDDHSINDQTSPVFDEIPRSTRQVQQYGDYTDILEPWTTITKDTTLVTHLLSIYFCWEYPAFSSLSKSHFLSDYESGRRRFCSSLLVNAILSLVCKYSDKPEGLADPDDSSTAGDHFFEEAQRL